MRDAAGKFINRWTDEKVEILTALWAEGKSTSQIAAIMGSGITRNAAIGKLHRLGLKGQKGRPGVPEKTVKAFRAVKPRKECAAALPPPSVVVEQPEPIALAPADPVVFRDLRDCQCRYIVGPVDGADTLYCGASRSHPSSYCELHRAITCGPGTPGERQAVPDFGSKSARTGAYR